MLTLIDPPTSGLGDRFSAWFALFVLARVCGNETVLLTRAAWSRSNRTHSREANQERDIALALECLVLPSHVRRQPLHDSENKAASTGALRQLNFVHTVFAPKVVLPRPTPGFPQWALPELAARAFEKWGLAPNLTVPAYVTALRAVASEVRRRTLPRRSHPPLLNCVCYRYQLSHVCNRVRSKWQVRVRDACVPSPDAWTRWTAEDDDGVSVSDAGAGNDASDDQVEGSRSNRDATISSFRASSSTALPVQPRYAAVGVRRLVVHLRRGDAWIASARSGKGLASSASDTTREHVTKQTEAVLRRVVAEIGQQHWRAHAHNRSSSSSNGSVSSRTHVTSSSSSSSSRSVNRRRVVWLVISDNRTVAVRALGDGTRVLSLLPRGHLLCARIAPSPSVLFMCLYMRVGCIYVSRPTGALSALSGERVPRGPTDFRVGAARRVYDLGLLSTALRPRHRAVYAAWLVVLLCRARDHGACAHPWRHTECARMSHIEDPATLRPSPLQHHRYSVVIFDDLCPRLRACHINCTDKWGVLPHVEPCTVEQFRPGQEAAFVSAILRGPNDKCARAVTRGRGK